MDLREGIVDMGEGIHVSHRDVCDKGLYPYGFRVLHIWRDDHPLGSCQMTQGKEPDPYDMVLNYKDGEALANADKSIEELEEFFRTPGPILIHCAVGQTRSPTLAVLALSVRGVDPYEATRRILKRTYKKRGIVWNVCLTPMQEILERHG